MTQEAWEQKDWGRVRHIKDAAASLLEVITGTRSSRHYHNHRFNLFAPTTCEIVVELFVPSDLVTEFIPSGVIYHIVHHEREASILCLLEPGDELTVAPNVWHRFRVLRSGKLVEVYWCQDGTPVDIKDIERADQGGEDDVDQLRREMGLAD